MLGISCRCNNIWNTMSLLASNKFCDIKYICKQFTKTLCPKFESGNWQIWSLAYSLIITLIAWWETSQFLNLVLVLGTSSTISIYRYSINSNWCTPYTLQCGVGVPGSIAWPDCCGPLPLRRDPLTDCGWDIWIPYHREQVLNGPVVVGTSVLVSAHRKLLVDSKVCICAVLW